MSAGLRKFLPVPPNISLPITRPKVIPIAACHKGKSGGQLNENKIVDTKAPSLISCFLTIAKTASHPIPTTKTVM